MAYWAKSGTIPLRWQPTLLDLARQGGIRLDTADFVAELQPIVIAKWEGPVAQEANLPTAAYGSPEKPLMIGGIPIDAYVLDDVDHTRVLARAGFVRAIGRTGKVKGGRAYDDELQTPVFLTADNLKPFISQDLLSNSKPIIFSANGKQVIGYRAELLPQVCEVYLDARDAGVLRQNQLAIAGACRALHRAFAKIGIIGLVDEATGFQQFREREAIQAFLDKFLRKELAAWVKTFPDEFFEQIFRLKNWPTKDDSRRPGVVGKYINDLIYDRLGPGVLEELRRKNPIDEKGRRKAKHFQWLTENIGHPALAQHMYATIGFMRAATDWPSFLTSFTKAYPKKGENLSLAFPPQ